MRFHASLCHLAVFPTCVARMVYRVAKLAQQVTVMHACVKYMKCLGSVAQQDASAKGMLIDDDSMIVP